MQHLPNRRWSSIPLLTGILIGLVASVLAGAILIWNGLAGLGAAAGRAGNVDRTPVSLPATLGDYRDVLDAMRARSADADKLTAQSAQQSRTAELTTADQSRANNGAAAGYRSYSDDTLQRIVQVIAVRAPSPRLTVGPVTDPAQLKLAISDQRVITTGPVDCLVRQRTSVPQGKQPDPEQISVTTCRRTSPELTVTVIGSGFDGQGGLLSMTNLTNAGFAALS